MNSMPLVGSGQLVPTEYFVSEGSKPNHTMKQVIRAFLAPLSPNSRITIRHGLQKAAAALGYADADLDQVPWHCIDAPVLTELVHRWGEEMSKASIRIYTYAVRGLVRSCYLHHMVSLEQYSLIKEVKVPNGRNRIGRGRYIEEKVRSQLIQSCATDERSEIGSRDQAMIALLFGAGVRRAEAVSVLIENLDLDEATLRVVVKGGDYVEKYLAAWAIPLLGNWLAVLRAQGVVSGPLLRRISKGGKALPDLSPNGLYKALQQRCLLTGVPVVKPHDARRSVATDLIAEHGLNIAKIALGHKSINTTMIYDMTDKKTLQGIFATKRY